MLFRKTDGTLIEINRKDFKNDFWIKFINKIFIYNNEEINKEIIKSEKK
jgi:hypothetical protein